MTVSVCYLYHDAPGNTVTGEWAPDQPVSTFLRYEVVTLNCTFEAFAARINREGLFRKTPAGVRLWIAPHRILQIEEERL